MFGVVENDKNGENEVNIGGIKRNWYFVHN